MSGAIGASGVSAEPTPDGARAILQKRIVAVLNIGSGSCDANSAAQAKAVFDQAGLSHAKVVAVEPADLDKALDDAVANADVLVVLGGDGTISAAATRCGGAGALLIPLPGGTMNMLPKALYGGRPWREALADTLANPKVHDVSGGKADDRPFFCAAILGAPSLWAQAREAARKGAVVEAIKRSITATRRSLTESLDYDFGGGLTGSSEAVVVICPAIAKDMNPDDPTLEAAAVDPETAAGLFGLAFHAAFDNWRNGASVSLAKVKTLSVTGHGEVPVILDGETVRLGRTVGISFVPVAFRALAPAKR
ncbi:MAG: diacylglycerol kinase related protein [Caulobacteraceae bacterium]|nr:diacylglycerol kinase related protein [Caulobacteraceae bacterium]